MIQKLLLVGLGGFIGSTARYGLSRFIDEAALTRNFPYATLIINIAGSLLLGIIYGITLKRADNPESINLVLGVGLCGGFTTFSSFAWENLLLLEQRDIVGSIFYSLSSLIGAMLAVWLGALLARQMA